MPRDNLNHMRHVRTTNQLVREFASILGQANIDNSEQTAFAEYRDRAMADTDGRTPILSFNEWISAGRPAGPFTNG